MGSNMGKKKRARAGALRNVEQVAAYRRRYREGRAVNIADDKGR
jgi:hypothetical protein